MSLSPPPPPPPPLDPVCGIDGDEDRNVSDDEASPENVQPARVAGDDRMSASVTIRKRRGKGGGRGGEGRGQGNRKCSTQQDIGSPVSTRRVSYCKPSGAEARPRHS